MGSVEKNLRNIEKIGSVAWECAEQGEFRTARRMLRKFDDSVYTSEVERFTALVEAKIFERSGNKWGAKERILASLPYTWGMPEAFRLLSCAHLAVDSGTVEMHIKIRGGGARLGIFTQFSDQHEVSFDVLANSEEEALTYVDEVCNFNDPAGRKVLCCTHKESVETKNTLRGIIRAYPFEIADRTQATNA